MKEELIMKKALILPLLIIPFTLTSCSSLFKLVKNISGGGKNNTSESSNKSNSDDESEEVKYIGRIDDPDGILLPKECRYDLVRETNKFDEPYLEVLCTVIINHDEILATYPDGSMRYYTGSFVLSDDGSYYGYIYREYDYYTYSGWQQAIYGGGYAQFALDAINSYHFFNHGRLSRINKTAYQQNVDGDTCNEYYTDIGGGEQLFFYYSPKNDVIKKYAYFYHEESKPEVYDMYYMNGYTTDSIACEIPIRPNI